MLPQAITTTISPAAQCYAQDPLYAQLPEDIRRDVMELINAMGRIERATKKEVELRRLARDQRGWAVASLRRKYTAWIRTRDWRVLVNKARAGTTWWRSTQRIGLPSLFVSDMWHPLVHRHQRKASAAYRELIQIWRNRVDTMGRKYAAIPGYSEWPAANPRTGVPDGWSERNLYSHLPTKFELTAARIGRTAANAYRPKVLTSRVGILPGQYYIADDQEYDLKVNFLGVSRQAMRPLGLDVLDLASACFVAHGFKPTTWDEIEEKKKKLKEEETMWLLIHVLTSIGYRTDTGTVLILEHGTASVSEAFESALKQVSGGLITIERSGIGGAPAFDGLFDGASKGNPRFKAPLESIYNLVRNEFAALPGQVGLDRHHLPEESHGLERYNRTLLQAAAALPPEKAELLRYPVLNWSQFVSLALDLYDRIDGRTDHALQGWEKAGNIANEWRPTPDSEWLPMSLLSSMSGPQQAAIHALIESQPHLARTRLMSPREVWDSRKDLTRLPGHVLPTILPLKAARLVRVADDHTITIQDQEIDPEPMHYLGRVSSEGREWMLNPGTYRAYLNPFSPGALYLCDDEGRYIGQAPLMERIRRDDTERLQRACGKAAKLEKELLQPVAKAGRDLIRERLEMHKHNATVLDPVTPEDRKRDAAERRAMNKVEETFEDLAEPEPTSSGSSFAEAIEAMEEL